MWIRFLLVLSVCALPLAASAQVAPRSSAAEDAEARALFDLGTAAFNEARYEDALGHFQHAYDLSHRAGLLYNVGLCADRLRHDAEALVAFERFLEEVPEHPVRRDVEARVAVLRGALADSEARARAAPPPPTDDERDEPGPGALTLVGPSVLGAAGLAGVVAGVVGVVGAGGCVDYAVHGDASTPCIEETGTRWLAVGAYGGLGLAALVGAVVWLVVGLSGGDADDAPLALTPHGAELSWRF